MSDLRDELYSLLVPLAGERLIVPRACVAEVIGYQAPAEMTNAPPWYAGLVSWSGRNVPVVSFEGAFGQTLPSISSRTRIVIFHAAGGKLQSGYFGMLTQGFPQLVRVNADVRAAGSVAQLSRALAGHLPGTHGQRDAADPGFGAPGANDRRGNLGDADLNAPR